MSSFSCRFTYMTNPILKKQFLIDILTIWFIIPTQKIHSIPIWKLYLFIIVVGTQNIFIRRHIAHFTLFAFGKRCCYEAHGERACVFSWVHSRCRCVELHCDRIAQRVKLSECEGSAVAQGRISVRLRRDGQRSWESTGEEGHEDLFRYWPVPFSIGYSMEEKCCFGPECPTLSLLWFVCPVSLLCCWITSQVKLLLHCIQN